MKCLFWFLVGCSQMQAVEDRKMYISRNALEIKETAIIVHFSQGTASVKQFGIDNDGYFVYPKEFMVPKSDR